jgi:hypothetical protein
MTGINSGKQFHQDLVHFLRKEVVFGDDGTTLSMGWLPSGASVIDGAVNVTTAFNAGTTNVCDIGFRNAGDGTADDTDEFATDLALGTAGVIAADELATAADNTFPEGAEIVVTPALTGTAATAGAAVAWISYIVDNSGA